MHFSPSMDEASSPMVASAQVISECASLLPPLSPPPPCLVNITSDQSILPASSNVTLLVPMNGPITPKPGEKVFIDNLPHFPASGGTVYLLPKPAESTNNSGITSSTHPSSHANDGIKLLIPVKGPSKDGETIFVKNAPNPGGPVFLIPSQTDPNEKVLVPASSQQGGNSGAIILVPQPKPKSHKHNSQATIQNGTRKRSKRILKSTVKDGPINAVVEKGKGWPLSKQASQGRKESPNKGSTVTTKNCKRVVNNKSKEGATSTEKASSASKKSNPSQPITRTTCLPATQRQPLILGDRARQMYEKNLNDLKSVIRTQKRKIQKQQRDLDRLRLEKKEGVKHLPKKHLCKLIRKHLPGYVGQFIEAQLINYGVEVKNKHRWEMSDKVFALAIWHRSPLAYKLLRETFAMPSVKTLQHWTATVPAELDFYDVLKELVRKKLPQDETEDGDDDACLFNKINGEFAGDFNGDIEGSDDSDTVIESDANDCNS